MASQTINSIREGFLEQEIEQTKGKSNYWPQDFEYSLKGGHLTVGLTKPDSEKTQFRGLDPWGLAVVVEATRRGIRVNAVSFIIGKGVSAPEDEVEALRRRVSYLAINNEKIGFNLVDEASPKKSKLYSEEELFTRPEWEVTRNYNSNEEWDPLKSHGGKERALEKDFQAFLGLEDKDKEDGKEGDKATKTNDRLAVLGEDFFKAKEKGYGVNREFSTGAFKRDGKPPYKPRAIDQILPTEHIDMVTFDKRGRLCVIELKLDDPHLEVISQILNYSLFFRSYVDHRQSWGTMRKAILDKLGMSCKLSAQQMEDKHIMCYVVNNRFHERFDDVAKYYVTRDESYGFTLKKVVLGYTRKLGE